MSVGTFVAAGTRNATSLGVAFLTRSKVRV
jgi:hypothetical protein